MVKYRTRSVADKEVQRTLEDVRNFVLNRAEKIPEDVMFRSQSYLDVLRWIENQLGLQNLLLDQGQYLNCITEWLDEVLEWHNKKQRQDISNPQTPTNKRTYTGKKIQVKIQQKNQLRNGNDDDDYYMSGDGYSHDDDNNFTSSNTRYATRSLKRLKLANSNQHKRIQINIGNKNNKNKMQQAFYKDQAEQNNYQNGCLIRNLNLLDAPNIVLEKIAIKLDHDSLFLFIQTNKQIYNCLKDSPVFWKTKCEQNGWEEEGTISRADDTSDDNNSESKSCKEKYKQMYQKNCYNCFNITDNFTFSFGKLCLRVCRECSRSTLITERNSHRLVTKTGSKFRYKVNDRELEQLSYALVPNMENAMFNLTSLYRKVDVVRLGVNKWGAHNARKNKFIEPKF